MKAKEVLDKLGITRQTLTKYVKEGLIKIDSEINGRYLYNDESVNNLLKNKKTIVNINSSNIDKLPEIDFSNQNYLNSLFLKSIEDIYIIFDLFVKMRLLTGESLSIVSNIKQNLDLIKDKIKKTD